MITIGIPTYGGAWRLGNLLKSMHIVPNVPGGPFDLVVCTEVIEHVVDPVALVRWLSRQVVVGGQVIATVSFDDEDGCFPGHLNVGVYDNETFMSEVFLDFGLVRTGPFTFRKEAP